MGRPPYLVSAAAASWLRFAAWFFRYLERLRLAPSAGTRALTWLKLLSCTSVVPWELRAFWPRLDKKWPWAPLERMILPLAVALRNRLAAALRVFILKPAMGLTLCFGLL